MNSTLVTLPGYHLIELIHTGERTLVYRAQNQENGQPVIIKLIRHEYPSFRELVQFRNQYAIAKNLDIEGIVKSIALERYEKRYALIMEDTGGVSLAEYEGLFSLSVAQFLQIAIQLSQILHQLHNNSIIHKDIKPANILIHPETQQIKLIDFSISSLLPKETPTLQPPNILEGTLGYLSPEQTGRMNRGIDYRSDFYSLGVTFYELLTGTLPFNKKDPLELIHAHMAESPTSISMFICLGGKVGPQALSDIVLKLMAKNAEDRYQSALGLKYDLEKCLVQYQETATIEPFELGQRDICNRFNIPEKLYGRETEVQTLLDAFNRVATGTSEMMLVAGFSGIGKTAVVNEVHKPIVKQRGYFIKGKFDQFNRNIPFSAFVIAFRSLMGQILGESDAELQQWKTKILEAVGNNGQVLIEVIPELERVIGKQPSVLELSGSAAQNRFNLLFEQFIAVFTTIEHPLVMFLDDLQWVDSASLNLMKVLMSGSEMGYLLLLGAYRDNEVFPAHPLMLTLSDLEKDRATISTITLKPLSEHHINQLVAETLSCREEIAQPLSELVYQKTQGNPFFATQFLKGLYEDELITFNLELGYWECDLVKVQEAALTDDVVEFMARRLQKLPETTQEVLKLAACVGNQFNLETLAIASEKTQEEVATNLWIALQEGLVLPMSEAYKFFQGDVRESQTQIIVGYRFLHDRVQQAAYFLIPDDQKQTTHYHIGQLLLQQIPLREREERIFEIVNQLNYGTALITAPKERNELAQLNLIAAGKARAATAYQAALSYGNSGIGLLRAECWQQDYELALELHDLAAETAYLNGDFEQMQERIEIVFLHARSPIERANAYTTKILACLACKDLSEAIAFGLEIVSLLGFSCPMSPTQDEIGRAIAEVEALIPASGIEELSELPLMSDPSALVVLKIVPLLMPPACIINPPLFILLALLGVKLSITRGNASFSAYAYATYGILSFIFGKDVSRVYQYGQLALSILDRFSSKEAHAKTLSTVGAFTIHWQSHLKDGIALCQSGYQSGLEVGDFDGMAWCAFFNHQCAFFSGGELSSFVEQLTKISQVLAKYEQKFQLIYSERLRQFTLNLLGRSENPAILVGEAYDEERSQREYLDKGDRMSLAYLYLYKAILSYWFDNHTKALDCLQEGAEFLDSASSQIIIPIFYFYESLTHLASCPFLPETERLSSLKKVESNQVKMKEWASNAPMNFQHKYDLVEAEKMRISGDRVAAIDLYDKAISGAQENEYIQEEALANELAAKFYLDWGKLKIAAIYMTDAYYCYARWGAKAKTDALEERYQELLKPILQRASLRGSLSLSSRRSLSTVSTHSQTATIANISSILDFSSLLKASQTLSGEIELDRLLSTLMKIILENAGATKGALLLTSETGLTLEALATRDNEDLQLNSVHQSIPLDDYPDLPIGLINYVRRNTQTALLDAKTAQEEFTSDRYLLHFSPQSLLCMPLLERGNLIGILYLENRLTADAFTSDRIELLDVLCAQAAISLTNARLYQQAQQAFLDLQEAQLQLVQNEKMATLGNLVAGVAHEINNPVGFIGGNIRAAQEYLQDLLEALSLYGENMTPSESVVEELEELDLEFVAEDFPKLLASMQTGCDRIGNISTSLRTFSRTDTASKTKFNLHAGIDSSLLILKYRLKANDNRPAIEIIKQYGNIPVVKCFPGQLNQVFMNLIANAIDALDESNIGKSFTEIERSPNRITLTTEFVPDENNVMVRITDNGMGMPEEVRAKIFEQGFTTKGVGKRTGLGMAIARQIVVNAHGGSLEVDSEVNQGTEFCIYLPSN